MNLYKKEGKTNKMQRMKDKKKNNTPIYVI